MYSVKHVLWRGAMALSLLASAASVPVRVPAGARCRHAQKPPGDMREAADTHTAALRSGRQRAACRHRASFDPIVVEARPNATTQREGASNVALNAASAWCAR